MNDVETFGAMAEGLEHVSNLITRYAIFENLYLHIGSAVEDQLADALHYQKLDEKWRKECFKIKVENFLLQGRDVLVAQQPRLSGLLPAISLEPRFSWHCCLQQDFSHTPPYGVFLAYQAASLFTFRAWPNHHHFLFPNDDPDTGEPPGLFPV